MKKLFISQPMKGKTNEEIEAERVHAIKSKASELIKSKYPIEKQSSA